MDKLTLRQQQALALLPLIAPRGGHRVLTTPTGGAPDFVAHLNAARIHERTFDSLVERGYLRVIRQQGMCLRVYRTR